MGVCIHVFYMAGYQLPSLPYCNVWGGHNHIVIGAYILSLPCSVDWAPDGIAACHVCLLQRERDHLRGPSPIHLLIYFWVWWLREWKRETPTGSQVHIAPLSHLSPSPTCPDFHTLGSVIYSEGNISPVATDAHCPQQIEALQWSVPSAGRQSLTASAM